MPGVGDAGSPHDELLQIRRRGQQAEIVVRRRSILQIDGDDVARRIARHLPGELFDSVRERLLIGLGRSCGRGATKRPQRTRLRRRQRFFDGCIEQFLTACIDSCRATFQPITGFR